MEDGGWTIDERLVYLEIGDFLTIESRFQSFRATRSPSDAEESVFLLGSRKIVVIEQPSISARGSFGRNSPLELISRSQPATFHHVRTLRDELICAVSAI
jgi:hypothetical protein